MASIQAMLSTSGNAPAAPASSHLADAQDGSFHAVLASYAAAAKPAHDVAPRDTHAVKSDKAIDRTRPSTDAKAARKEARAEEKAAKKTEKKSEKSPADSPSVTAVEAVRAPAPVRAALAPQSAANDDGADAEDAPSVEQTVAPAATAAPNTQLGRAAPSLKNIADAKANAPIDPRAKAASADTATKSGAANDQNAPAKEISRQAMDEIVAAAKSDAQQPAPSTAPRIAQTLAANVTAMLNAVRGTMTVSSPKQAAPAKTDTPDVASTARTTSSVDIVSAQQSGPAGKAAQNSQNDPRDASRDPNRAVSDDAAKTDVAATDQPAVNPMPATAAPQPVAPATQVVAVATPNAVNATAPSQAGAAQHTPSPAAQGDTQPNIPALAAAIAGKSAAGTKTFDIRMDPPEMGRVDVHLTVDRDGKVQATLSAEQPQTLALLKQDSHNLERSLKDAGLDLSNNSLNFSLKGEERQGDGGGASMARARSLPDAVVARAEAANASLSSFNTASGDGRLDIRV
ncbi:MAG TPA: flagellar hook-length control protein FliK [Rhizomicrobium sp.]|nr:flagellar hook-length control protein FliK [Rhizomicrobium sp.]